MNSKTERDWKGIWIPREVWEHPELTWYDKIILMEVDSFTKRDMDCFVSDRHLADFVGISERTVRKGISRLESLGLLARVGFDGRKRFMRSLLPTNVEAKTGQAGTVLLPVGHEEPKKKTSTNTNEKIIYPWDNQEFIELWDVYKSERKALKRKALTPTGEQAALHMLQRDSDNNMEVAMEAIRRSIANGYQGIFVDKKHKAKPREQWDGQALDAWATAK